MKRILSLLLAAVILILAVPFVSNAAPEDKCLKFGDDGAYVVFQNGVSVSPSTGGSVSFDLAFTANNNGDPIVKLCGDNLQLTPTSVIIGGVSTAITWLDASLNHWRKIEYSFSSDSVTVSIDGVAVATGQYSNVLSPLYLICYPGEILIDNFMVVSGGSEVMFLDFDNVSAYNSYVNTNDSSADLADVPAGSYYDYSPVLVPENVSYIFNSAANAAKFSIRSGVTMYRGDVNEDDAVDQKDLRNLKKIIAGDNTITYRAVLADVNSDDAVDSKDTLRLKKVLAGSYALERVTINGGAGSGTVAYDQGMDSALLTATQATGEGIDATLAMTAINAEEYPYAVITYMTPNMSVDHNSAVANKSAFGAWGNFKQYDLTTDGRFHSAIVDLSDVSTWNGDAATLRFFTAANAGDRIYIDSIIFAPNLGKANVAKAERESANMNKRYNDDYYPDPTGKIGEYDEYGNYVIRFDARAKIDSKVSPVRNTRVTFADTSLKATATAGADPSCYVDLIDEGISASTFKYIAYVYKNPSSNGSSKGCNLYYVCNDIDVPTGGYQTDIGGGVKGEQYNSYVYDLTSKSNWTGAIKGLRIDYFTDCNTNDTSYIDSIIFAASQANANKAATARLRDRNGSSADDTAGVWNNYWQYCKNANSNEYITGDDSNLVMYFRYGSYDALTARSLGDRMARAITNATGIEVTCTIYGLQFAALKQAWGNAQPETDIYYCIKYEGVSYVVCVHTCIIKVSGYTDPLDGTSADPAVDFYNLSSFTNAPGYSISDVHSMGSFSSYMAYHSNHESKMVETPYGAFAVYHTSGNPDNGNYCGGGQSSVFRVLDDGTSKRIFTYDCTAHSTKPYIHYGDDGLVYFVQCDDEENMDTCAISLGYFDPSQPKSDGTYDVTYSRSTKAYPGGRSYSGYGYSSSVIDPYTGNIYMWYNGGGGGMHYYIAWFVYNYRTHTWGSSHNILLNNTYRHCYTYLFPDGQGGMYVVGERDVELTELGLQNTTFGADYAWDAVDMIHITDMDSTNYTYYSVYPPDYTQTGRSLFPAYMNAYSECYVTQDGKLHVFWMKGMHGTYLNDGRSQEMWHAIYDVSGAKEPELLYKEPISFTSTSNCYTIRFCENTSGHLFIIAVHANEGICEIWRATDALGSQFELKAIKYMSKLPATGILAGTRRTNSIVDNTVTVALASEADSRYYSFVVTLPSN